MTKECDKESKPRGCMKGNAQRWLQEKAVQRDPHQVGAAARALHRTACTAALQNMLQTGHYTKGATQGGCTNAVLKEAAQRGCTKWLHKEAAQRGCTKGVLKEAAQRGWTKGLHKGAAQQDCTNRLHKGGYM